MKVDRKDFLKEFGIKIRQLRQMNGWTQKQLAEMCGYKSGSSNSTINKIETGKSDISISKLIVFSEIFGVSTSYLLGEGDSSAETEKIAKENAMRIMRRKLNEKEQGELLRGLELYFTQKAVGEN